MTILKILMWIFILGGVGFLGYSVWFYIQNDIREVIGDVKNQNVNIIEPEKIESHTINEIIDEMSDDEDDFDEEGDDFEAELDLNDETAYMNGLDEEEFFEEDKTEWLEDEGTEFLEEENTKNKKVDKEEDEASLPENDETSLLEDIDLTDEDETSLLDDEETEYLSINSLYD